ncbi:dTMP kinase [Mycoplasmopsis bovigenitalium]|uniref:dTMP kinase n=1 Tax=Mycoplasmopsis bovigenitalium TaxID=2112 RepID=UPI00090B462E|nr:dTMP kinase [Mycoplasmopsis bovigenitalium]BAW18274.1 dTMP kinase [Mycoplasmopsis bovigenitalium]
MFITFEGPDASGKTTILNKLIDFLNKNYPEIEFITTREPGGKHLVEAEKIREIILNKDSILSPEAEAILYSASRRIHLDRVVIPALSENKLVICDRYVDSFYAYQGYARGLGLDYVKAMTNLVINGLMPDITVFFNITPEQSKARMNQERLIEQHDRLDCEGDNFHRKVYNGYLDLINQDPKRFIIINANQSIEEVFLDLKQQLFSNQKFIDFLKNKGINVSE